MTGYTRQSLSQIQTGQEVQALPLNNEFDALQTAFNATTGHTHDGTVGSGPKVSLTGSVSGVLPIANGGTNAATASAARTSLGLAIGTDVQAFDAGLQSISGLTTVADRMIYTTASDTYAVTTLTSFARTILDDADATTARATLGLGTAATQNTGTSGGTIPFLNGTNTWSGVNAFNDISINSSMYRNVDNGVLNIFGGTSGLGANIELYGSTHATQANNAYYDSAAHAFRGINGTGTPTVTIGGSTVWHAGNDGAGSGLDADLLDGQSSAFYQSASNINAGTLADARLPTSMANKQLTGTTIIDGITSTSADALFRNVTNASTVIYGGTSGDGANIELYGSTHASTPSQAVYDANTHSFRQANGSGTPTVTIGGGTVWHSGNDGAGSGLDADLLDGQSSAFYQAASTAWNTSNASDDSVTWFDDMGNPPAGRIRLVGRNSTGARIRADFDSTSGAYIGFATY